MSGNAHESSVLKNHNDTLAEAVTAAGYRLTSARRTVIACLVQSGGHISADELVKEVHSVAPHVGRMTVYRTLELLSDLGQIQPTYQGTGAAHYVLMSKGSHHHLICVRCHCVIDFDRCGAGASVEKLGQQYSFRVQSHMLEVYGFCASCQDR